MRRAACDSVETKLRALGVDFTRTYDGPAGYLLITTAAGQVRTKREAAALLDRAGMGAIMCRKLGGDIKHAGNSR